MTISNQASGIRTGVCTSTTRPITPYDGQVIYETDTDRTLVWNNSAWVALSGLSKVTPSSVTGGTINADGSVTVGSAVSTVVVNGVFSANFDHYRIIYQGGSASAANDLAMRLGSTNTGYYENMIYKDWGAGAILGQALTGGGAQWNYVGCQDVPNSISIDLFNPFNAVKTAMSGLYTGVGTGRVGGVINGFLNDTSSYTSFTILTNAGAATGTITGGTLRVYGYSN